MHLMSFSEFCESPSMHWTSSTIYNLQSTIYTVLCLFVVVSMIEFDPHMIFIKHLSDVVIIVHYHIALS